MMIWVISESSGIFKKTMSNNAGHQGCKQARKIIKVLFQHPLRAVKRLLPSLLSSVA